jgi:hypothetical protein
MSFILCLFIYVVALALFQKFRAQGFKCVCVKKCVCVCDPECVKACGII